MTLTFRTWIDGRQIRCLIGSDLPLSAPVFCFSMMAAPKVIAGGTMVRRVAGYAEVALPDCGGLVGFVFFGAICAPQTTGIKRQVSQNNNEERRLDCFFIRLFAGLTYE